VAVTTNGRELFFDTTLALAGTTAPRTTVSAVGQKGSAHEMARIALPFTTAWS